MHGIHGTFQANNGFTLGSILRQLTLRCHFDLRQIFTGVGPLLGAIVLLMEGESASHLPYRIRASFTVPIKGENALGSRRQEFEVQLKWSKCSKECGGGRQRASYRQENAFGHESHTVPRSDDQIPLQVHEQVEWPAGSTASLRPTVAKFLPLRGRDRESREQYSQLRVRMDRRRLGTLYPLLRGLGDKVNLLTEMKVMRLAGFPSPE